MGFRFSAYGMVPLRGFNCESRSTYESNESVMTQAPPGALPARMYVSRDIISTFFMGVSPIV